MCHRAAAVCLVLAIVASAAHAADKGVVRNYFNFSADGLLFATDLWSIRSAPGRGWVSLKAGDAEFLGATDSRGGLAFRAGAAWASSFPDQGTVTHDETIGRTGSVADGTFLLKVTPDPRQPRFELYAGYNDKLPRELVMFLGDDVAFVRLGCRPGADRTWAQRVVRRGDSGGNSGGKGLAQAQGAVIVHKTGRALVTAAGCKVGTVIDPAGAERLAVVFDTKGFAANSINFEIEPSACAENFVLTPQFDVISSDDPPAGRMGGPLAGVGNPAYGPGTKLDFNIELGWLKDEPFDGFVELDVIHALGQQHVYERRELKGVRPDKLGRIRVHFDPKFRLAGVSDVWGRICDAGGRLLWVARYRMAWDWPAYRPAIRVQPDMKQFWDDTLTKLRAVPLEPQIKRVFEDHPVLEVYEVSYNGWGGKRVYAALYVPKAAAGGAGSGGSVGRKPMPAIVGSHPGTTDYDIQKDSKGQYGSKVTQDLRFVQITPFLRNKPGEEAGFNQPWWGPVTSRDEYTARDWYCRMVRAVDYLASRPELVDVKRIVARGGSQGGALALVTAGLDHRVAYCFADCPANCQPSEIMHNYGSFGPSLGIVAPGQTAEQVETILSYYNPVNFCPWIQCPTYVGSNIGDLTVHSMGPLAAFHNLTALAAGQKDFFPGFTHEHGSGPGLWAKQQAIFEQLAGPPAKAEGSGK